MLQTQLPRLTQDSQWGAWRLYDVMDYCGRQFALAERNGERYVLSLVPEYFKPAVRHQLMAELQPLLRQLGVPFLGYTLETYQGVPFIVSCYPAELWEQLGVSAQRYLQNQGLLEQADREAIYGQMLDIHRQLDQANWVNPGFILPFVFLHQNRWISLNWEYCLPLNSDLVFPEFYLGYHASANQFKMAGHNQRLALSALRACLLEILTGKSPRLWAPEPMQIDYFSAWLPPDLAQQLTTDAIQTWADFPTPDRLVYRSETLESEIRQANRYTEMAEQYLRLSDFDAALESFDKASWFSDRDPWIAAQKARIYLAIKADQQAREQIELALKFQPHSQFYALRAQIHARNQHWSQAEADCLRGLSRWRSHDEIWAQLAQIYQAQFKSRKALKAWKKAYTLRPRPEYQNAIDQLQQSLGHLVSAGVTKRVPVDRPARLHIQAPSEQAASLPVLPSSYRLIERLDSQPDKTTQLLKVQHIQTGQQSLLKAFSSPLDFVKLPRQQYDSALSWPKIVHHQENDYLSRLDSSGIHLQAQLEARRLLTDKELRQLLRTLLPALHDLQTGPLGPLVHGDIKPANLVYHQGRFFLVDLEGLAPPGSLAAHQNYTPEYADPQLRYHHTTSTMTDYRSLGLSLMHLATGIFPSLLEGDIPGTYPHWKEYALHLTPEVRAAIQSLLQGEAPPIPRLINHLVQPSQQVLRRSRWLFQVSQCQTPENLEKLAHWRQKNLSGEGIWDYHLAWHARRLGVESLFFNLLTALRRVESLRLKTALLVVDYWLEKREWQQAEKTLLPFIGTDILWPEFYLACVKIYFAQGKTVQGLAAVQHLRKHWNSLDIQLWLVHFYADCGLYQRAWLLAQQLLHHYGLQPAARHQLQQRLNGLRQKLELTHPQSA